MPPTVDPSVALRESTDGSRAAVIADIIGHPKGAPSIKELDYMNPSLKVDALRRHIDILQDIGVVEELVTKPEDRIPEHPHKFYTLSEEAEELFDQNDLFDESAWSRQYAHVQRSDEIKRLEEIPRPR